MTFDLSTTNKKAAYMHTPTTKRCTKIGSRSIRVDSGYMIIAEYVFSEKKWHVSKDT